MGILDQLLGAYLNGPSAGAIQPPPADSAPFPPSLAGMLSVPRQQPKRGPGMQMGDEFGLSGEEGASPWGNVAAAAAQPDGFGAGAKPILAISAMGDVMAPQPPAADVPLPRPRPAGLDAMAAGDVPLPTPRPAGAPGSVPSVAAPAPAAPAPAAGPGVLDHLRTIANRNPSMLMAMGAGMMGAPSFAKGMSRGLAAAVPASQQDTANNLKMSGIQESYKSLVAAGASPADALAAVYNPEVMKAITPRVFGKAMKWTVVGSNLDGTPRHGFVDEGNGTVVPGDTVTKPRVNSIEDALRLPKGSHFIDPSGIERVR